MRSSRLFRRARFCSASKITPHKSDALLQAFVLMLQIFKNHDYSEFAYSGIHFTFRNVSSTRIAETNTHIQANQSPNRVYSVLSVRKSYGRSADSRMSRRITRVIFPYGSTEAVIPLLVSRSSHRLFSTARTRAIRKCCSAAADVPNHPSFEMLISNCAPRFTNSRTSPP